MGLFDEKFYKREKKYRRNYPIDNGLYQWLEQISLVYEASVTDLLNACLGHLIEVENIRVYENPGSNFSTVHTLLIREGNLAGLEHLKAKYGVSIYKLVNISIKNIFDEYEAQRG